MSTKSSIAWGDDFHLYGEALEEDGGRYLELRGVEFHASPAGVTVKIPAAIWEVIRHLGGADLSLVDLTDEDLRERAEQRADRNLASYAEAVRSEGGGALGRVWGWDRPRDEQAAEIEAELREARDAQRRLKAEVEAIRAGMRPRDVTPGTGETSPDEGGADAPTQR
jgi:hypothetical protein